MSTSIPILRALISVSDKAGLEPLARALHERGVEILSTGGTARTLRDSGLPVTDVSDHTGFPEIMDGRVKTLHPTIHGGLLGVRNDPDHARAMETHDIVPIDLLIVTLYPFAQTVAKGADFETCIENIDIGGPAMIRSAAKNHAFVTVLTDPSDYDSLMSEIETHGGTDLAFRRRMAAKAFAHTALYDSMISNWFAGQIDRSAFPDRLSFGGVLKETLRYGENPHQAAALYLDPAAPRPGAATARQIQGKEISYNNIGDTDAAFELVAEFDEPSVAIIKHANPCGVAVAETTLEAYEKALRCDPVSAFGGIVALNRTLDAPTAQAIIKRLCEVVIAPAIAPEALDILKTKPNIRVLETGALPDRSAARRIVAPVAGGFLIQDADTARVLATDLKVVTKRAPTPQEIRDMIFGFTVVKHVKSNAIVYARGGASVGIGAGQMSRVDAALIAARKAQDAAREAGETTPLSAGSIVASDAFFPFPDGLIAAHEAGATAAIQPGGSKKDPDVIATADERGMAMVFTGLRHFQH
ncbi:MAG: bifunctional phosphoribosylaminoimidazolecarboxamide formyltransferase/IMP cyclohydrolase [Rhodospirillales bacterium]|nr:bifunctional phosphoribosylaminoimidazolecarboxamide formyltransferase/IMP cyclohydrolase [Rhodospirillales bacterium]